MPFFVIFLLTMSLTVSGCSNETSQPIQASANPPEVLESLKPKKVLTPPTPQWVAKISRLLRNGKTIRANEMKGLLKLSRQEIVDQFIEEPAFADTVLAFNLYFIGRSDIPVLSNNGTYSDRVFGLPHVITSAAEVQRNGDYFKLFDLKHPVWFGQMDSSAKDRYLEFGFDAKPEPIEGYEELSPEQRRQAHLEPIRKIFDHFMNDFDFDSEAFDREPFCKEWNGQVYLYNTTILLGRSGFKEGISDSSFYWYDDISRYCNRANPSTAVDPRKALMAHLERIERFYRLGPSLEKEVYAPKSLADLRQFDLSDFNVSADRYRFNSSFWFSLQNSSTNLNRKRAAYFLSRFFCDDLTPIGFVEPGEHAKGKHGTDPTCYACHYKLDPMAGFFKTIGSSGRDYSQRDEITFDDGAKIPLDEYLQNWKSESSTRDWNIGYIRSETDERLNTYGENLADLLEILKTAPEVKSCVVKKMTEFLLGPETNIDAGYLDYLANGFIEKAKTNSGVAFKEIVREIALSNTIAHEDPDPSQCYDYAPGVDPDSQPPCQVAFLFRKNCASCHNTTSPQNGLDLTRWITLDNGEKSFPYEDIDGTQYSKEETFRAILARISSSNPRFQMPPSRHFATDEREKMFLWVNQYIEGGAR